MAKRVVNEGAGDGQLPRKRHSLDGIFSPRSVAVIGANERAGSVGRQVLQNLLAAYPKEKLFAVNPKGGTILGLHAYPGIGEVPETVDLAMIITPAMIVPEIIRQCVAAGVGGAIIISAGFRETGEKGALLEHEIQSIIRGSSLRVLGPNCLGIMRPAGKLNATFAPSMALPGSVAFISQSGALCTAILDWSHQEKVGFSAFISIGSMLDIGWGDVIDYLSNDPLTRSILIYMEAIGDARAFLSAAREVAPAKPIIVLKSGRTKESAAAAISHTGTLAGSDQVLDAAFQRAGILRVHQIAELFYMAEVLSKQPRPRGPRLTVLTNAGGPGVLAADALIQGGGKLAELPDNSRRELDAILPAHWSGRNPVDILGDADPQRYATVLQILQKNPLTDGYLIIHAPQGMSSPADIAAAITWSRNFQGRPVIASWMGGREILAGKEILRDSHIPSFPFPDTAARVFNYMWQYSTNLEILYETPTASSELPVKQYQHAKPAVHDQLAKLRAEGREVLSELESKAVLDQYDIPVVPCRLARSASQAEEIASKIGFPVVLKVHSKTVTHKAEAGGVKLNLISRKAVRAAYREINEAVLAAGGQGAFDGVTVQPMVTEGGCELILGSRTDAQFGPVMLFGWGGRLVEVLKDYAIALPPLNVALAHHLMAQTRIFQALKSPEGKCAVDTAALAQLLVRFSQLVVEQPMIKEIEINPLLAGRGAGEGAAGRKTSFQALDARIVLHPATIAEEALPRPAIRPYPLQYAAPWLLRDGSEVMIRPIRPEDEAKMIRFHETLSDQSVYLRYFHPYRLSDRVAHQRLARLCFIDYNREMALVAERPGRNGGASSIIAVGRLIRLHGKPEAEFAIVVSDQYQKQGLGTELLHRLVAIGREEGLQCIVADMLPENLGMQRASEKTGFQLFHDFEEGVVKARIDL